MNNIIKRIWNQNKLVQIEDLSGMTFQAESGGHTFQIYGINDAGETVSFSGTPSGVFLRPDNTDVTLSCSVSEGVVSATLPAECYSLPGRGGITVFITENGQKTALYAAVVTVSRTSSGNVAPPATQTVVDLVNAISAAVATIPASYSVLMADIAPTYSDSALYSVGQYAWYEGDLKRCISPITTAESFTPAHWTSAVLGSDVSDLKSAVKDRTLYTDTAFTASLFPLMNGFAVNSVGRYTQDENAVSGGVGAECTFVYAGTKITANDGYKFSYALWDIPVTSSADVAHRIIMRRGITAGETITISQDGYFAFSCKKADDSSIPSGKTIYEFANDAVSVELLIRTVKMEIKKTEDNLMSQSAELQGISGWIGKNNNPVESIRNHFVMSKNVCKNTNYTDGYYIKPNGTLVPNSTYKTSDYFMVEPNTQYYLYNSNSTIVFYNFNKDYIWGIDRTSQMYIVTSPNSACFARYSTNGLPSTWNVSKGTSFIDTPYFEPFLDISGYETSPFFKGQFNICKPDVDNRYECECLKENPNLFNFSLGSDTAHTGTQYADVIALLDELVSYAETGYITKTAIGTGSGTDINGNQYTLYEYAFVPKTYSVGMSNKKHPKILIDSSIHGFEKNSTFGIFALLYDIAHNWQKNSFLATLRHFVEIRWVPVSDPYGFDNNIRNNANDVNLNRNFPADGWTPGEGIDYGGEAPLDQPEASALATWLQANSDMLIYLNLHTNGHYYANGYGNANACMPYTNIGDDYYNKLFNAIKRHIERQTAVLPTEFNVLTPSRQQFIGKLQASTTSTSGFADQYVCAYLRSALAMTLEGCNFLYINDSTSLIFDTGSIKMNAEIYGNFIAEVLYEYL